jgi:hypothetical protein
MILKALLFWLVMLIFANLNGAFREFALKKFLSESAAHIVSTILLSIIFLIIAYLFVKRNISGNDFSSFVLVGVIWLVLTLSFEFLVGHYIFGNPWSKLLYDYNLAQGRIWVIVPVLTLFAPMIFYKILR